MGIPDWMRLLELPLLKRELIESAQRKRTYALRVLLLLILALIFTAFYMELSSRRSTALRMMGSGRELSLAIVVADLLAIYALLPALACGAIASERERQTLPLLLASRMSPTVIILEKFTSRLIPMVALLVISSPILAVTYVLGGVTLRDLSVLIIVLLTASVQAASTAILSSSICATAMTAFWATYGLLAAMALVPPLLGEMGLLPDLQLVRSLPSSQEQVPFTMFFLMLDRMWWSPLPLFDAVLACTPVWAVAVLAILVSRFALVRIGTGPGIKGRWVRAALQMLRHQVRRAVQLILWVAQLPRRISRSVSRSRDAASAQSGQVHSEAVLQDSLVPVSDPIAWRELQSSLTSSWELAIVVSLIVLGTGFWLLETLFTSRWDREGLCILLDVGVLIIGLLLVLTRSCHMFAAERERQTLDSLLTIPVTNREILRQKQSSARRVTVLWLLPLTAALVLHLGYVELHVVRRFPSFVRQNLIIFSGPWWSQAALLSVTIWSHSIVYMSITRWTGILFGLRFHSQMKAMIGSLVSLIVLVFVPAICLLVGLLMRGIDPDNCFPLCLSSPALTYGFVLTGDLQRDIGQAGWFGGSAWPVVAINFVLYGSLALILRQLVLWNLPRLLNRRDTEQPVSETSDHPMAGAASDI